MEFPYGAPQPPNMTPQQQQQQQHQTPVQPPMNAPQAPNAPGAQQQQSQPPTPAQQGRQRKRPAPNTAPSPATAPAAPVAAQTQVQPPAPTPPTPPSCSCCGAASGPSRGCQRICAATSGQEEQDQHALDSSGGTEIETDARRRQQLGRNRKGALFPPSAIILGLEWRS